MKTADMSFHIVIPARFASSRLPGKPLLDIAGKPMIQHVYERACESHAASIVIATDDQRIAETAQAFGADVCMTASEHPSGTDRLAEVVQKRGFDDDAILVNVQGDEPCLPATLITQVAEDLANYPDADMASLYTSIEDSKDVFDPNIVKVVVDSAGFALYFSRAPMPWLRDEFEGTRSKTENLPHNRHIGLYGYRARFLKDYASLPVSPLEQYESLEQLRALYHGKKIHMSRATIDAGHGVDTASDLEKVRSLLAK
jgi:3-deoxy-manno-octulosonate cytidylyltransferase (CMP-KDO synthetase)